MPKNLKFLKIGHILLGITTVLGMNGGHIQQLLAQEHELDTLCRLYPFNSRCRGAGPSSQPPPGPYQPPQPYEPPPPIRPPQPYEPPPPRELPPNPPQINRFPEDYGTGFAINGKAGTLGLGVDLTGRILPNLNARIGFNALSFNAERDAAGINYDGSADLRSGAAMLDYYPVRDAGFHFTGGLIYNRTKLEGSGQPSSINGVQSFKIGDNTFNAAQVGSLEADVKFPDFVPYFGIGWGNAVAPGKKLGLFLDLGVMLQGSPEVNLSASNADRVPLLADSLDKERRDLEDDLGFFRFYPVLQIGVTYQF